MLICMQQIPSIYGRTSHSTLHLTIVNKAGQAKTESSSSRLVVVALPLLCINTSLDFFP